MHRATLAPPVSSSHAKLVQPLYKHTTRDTTNHSAALQRPLPNSNQYLWGWPGLNRCFSRSVLLPENPHATKSQQPFVQAQYIWIEPSLGAFFQDELNLFLYWLSFIDYFSSLFLFSYFFTLDSGVPPLYRVHPRYAGENLSATLMSWSSLGKIWIFLPPSTMYLSPFVPKNHAVWPLALFLQASLCSPAHRAVEDTAEECPRRE